jgi:alkaline phosphatase
MIIFKFPAKKYLFRLILLGACLVFFGQTAAANTPVKNLIVLIMDGCGDEQLTLARWYKGRPLALDAIRTGAVKSFIADSVIADSAPAASAYATGTRTGGKIISLTPKSVTIPGVPKPSSGQRLQPCATVLEGARLLGKSTGLVATCRFSHATPAAYAAHVPKRDMEEDISEQMVYQNLDVLFGGGRRLLLPGNAGGARQDQEDLTRVLRERNYLLVDNMADLKKLDKPKVFGLFAASHLEPEIDRLDAAPEQPSLAEMTKKAIELLAANPAGFFLMVEASQIDWACHANDPAHLLGDLLMYDQAVQVALDFAKKDGQTLVLALPDHNTGGLSIGNNRSDKYYAQLQPEALIAPLKKMQLSAPALWRRLGDDKTPEKIKDAVAKYWGLEISLEDAQKILEISKPFGKEGHYALGKVICPKYTDIGWTTHGHTGGDIPLFAYGPDRPVGLLDAPDIGRVSALALGLDLENLTSRLFVEAQQQFPGEAIWLDRTDPNNPIIRIKNQGREAVLPVNKNILTLDGREILLEGIVVHVPDTDKIYLPLQAVQLIRGESKSLPPITK